MEYPQAVVLSDPYLFASISIWMWAPISLRTAIISEPPSLVCFVISTVHPLSGTAPQSTFQSREAEACRDPAAAWRGVSPAPDRQTERFRWFREEWRREASRSHRCPKVASCE